MAWLSYIELDKAVVHVIRLASFLIMVSVCLPLDALSQHLPSYLGFSYLGHGISLHGCSSKVQLLLLTLDVGYLLAAARCSSWTIRKAECQRIDAFELWCWSSLLRVP